MQIDTSRVPGRIRASAAASAGVKQASGADGLESAEAGITTVSARSSSSGPWSTMTLKSALVAIGRPSSVQVATS